MNRTWRWSHPRGDRFGARLSCYREKGLFISAIGDELAQFLWVCLGGAIGTGARYLLAGATLRVFGTAIPFGTLAVNLIGSFFLCAVMRLGLTAGILSPTVRIFLSAGVLGGFTTYSTFNYETLELGHRGAYGLATLYLGLTVVGCLFAGSLGDLAAKTLTGR